MKLFKAALTADTSSEVNVYAWYGSELSVMPSVNTTEISVQTNQNKEDGYMKSLYLSAHQQVLKPVNSLAFAFKHLVAHLRIDIKSEDGTVTQNDILASTVKMEGIHYQGTVDAESGSGNDWILTAKEGTATVEMMKLTSSWSVEKPFDISHQCYLIPQTLTAANPDNHHFGKREDLYLFTGSRLDIEGRRTGDTDSKVDFRRRI